MPIIKNRPYKSASQLAHSPTYKTHSTLVLRKDTRFSPLPCFTFYARSQVRLHSHAWMTVSSSLTP